MLKKIRNFIKSFSSDDLRADSIRQNNSSPRRDGWLNILTGLGTARDKKMAACFRSCRFFGPVELDELYRADGLTRRIIDIVASEMLRQGWEVDGDPENLIIGSLEEIMAYKQFNHLIQWSRLYGGAVMVMGIADGRPLDQPVNINNIESVNWLQVFDRWQTQAPQQYMCTDLNDPNYGLCQLYEITDYRTGANFLVHYTRILRMDWGLMPNREKNWNLGWGDSAIVPIYEELKNYGSAFGNLATIMQDFVDGVLKIPGLSQSLVTSECDSQIMKRLDFANMSKGITNMMVLDGDETFEKLSTNVSGISEVIDRFMLSVSSVTGIPVTLLFGRSPAGLNATGDADIRNFYDMIKQYQEMKLKPLLEKITYYLFKSKRGPTNGVEPENWSIQFTPLWQNSEEQEANVRRTVAETDAIYIDRGVLDPNEVAISRFGGDRYSMNTIIDVKAREGGYDPNEVQSLEAEKEEEIKIEPPEAQIGPNRPNRGNIVIVDGNNDSSS